EVLQITAGGLGETNDKGSRLGVRRTGPIEPDPRMANGREHGPSEKHAASAHYRDNQKPVDVQDQLVPKKSGFPEHVHETHCLHLSIPNSLRRRSINLDRSSRFWKIMLSAIDTSCPNFRIATVTPYSTFGSVHTQRTTDARRLSTGSNCKTKVETL